MFLVGLVKRYWKALLLLLVIEAGRHVEKLLYFIGPAYFLFELVVASIVAALMVRNMFMRDTLDAYVNHEAGDTSLFVKEWDQLQPNERIAWSLIVICVFFLGACWIAASLAK